MAEAPPSALSYLEIQPAPPPTSPQHPLPPNTHLQQQQESTTTTTATTTTTTASAIDLELDEIVRLARADDSQASAIQSNSNSNNNRRSPSSDTNGFATAPGTSEEDNMDSDSDDDDDSRSNYSSSNLQSNSARSSGNAAGTCNQRQHKNKKHFQKGEQKRSHHNVLERKRRDLLKDSFSKLRDSVPTFQKDRVSRAEILKQAANFLQITVQRNASVRAEVDELIRKNNELEQSLMQASHCNSFSSSSQAAPSSVVVVSSEQASRKEPVAFRSRTIKQEEHSST